MERKVWLQYYTQGVPDTINPDSFSSLTNLFEKYADTFKDRPVYTCFNVSLSYMQVEKLTEDLAAFLQKKLKLKKGARIAIMMPNILQYPVAIFGILKAGMIVVNVNPLYTAPELAFQLQDSGAEAIIVLENFARRVEKVLPTTSVKHVIITKIGDLLGFAKGMFLNFMSRYVKGKVPDYHLPNAIYFKKALSIGKKLSFDDPNTVNTDVAFFQYTGGTTGRAKAAMLTHRNIIANVLQCVYWIRDLKAQYFGVMIGALPLYHIFSLTVCGMCIFPMGASTLLIPNPRDTKSMIKMMRHCKMTMMIGLNTLFNALVSHPDFKKVDFSRLNLTMSGGMAMHRAVAERWHKITGVPVLEGYGLTETSPVITMCPANTPYFTGSVGVPISSTEVVIRDDNKQDLPLNKTGEIWARGPQIMKGYWQCDDETHDVIDQAGWLRTGDLGYMDERGFVFIVDRKKDMVLVSGFNVYPNEVEAVISMHPGVQTVAVIGIPSEKTGEALKAFIVKRDPNLTKAELIAHCRSSLTNYKVPRLFEFRDSLPLSNVGKVLRRELRDQEMQRVTETMEN